MKIIKVLCFVKYWVRIRNSTRTRIETVMVKVVKADGFIVENIFERQMPVRLERWNAEHVGDKPNAYALVAYLTDDGTFQRVTLPEARIN